MIYECTDCEYCADFAHGFRIFCMHPELEACEALEFSPLTAGRDAWACVFFDDSNWAHSFTWEELGLAEEGSRLLTEEGLVTYEGIRAWVWIYLAGMVED